MCVYYYTGGITNGMHSLYVVAVVEEPSVSHLLVLKTFPVLLVVVPTYLVETSVLYQL